MKYYIVRADNNKIVTKSFPSLFQAQEFFVKLETAYITIKFVIIDEKTLKENPTKFVK